MHTAPFSFHTASRLRGASGNRVMPFASGPEERLAVHRKGLSIAANISGEHLQHRLTLRATSSAPPGSPLCGARETAWRAQSPAHAMSIQPRVYRTCGRHRLAGGVVAVPCEQDGFVDAGGAERLRHLLPGARVGQRVGRDDVGGACPIRGRAGRSEPQGISFSGGIAEIEHESHQRRGRQSRSSARSRMRRHRRHPSPRARRESSLFECR